MPGMSAGRSTTLCRSNSSKAQIDAAVRFPADLVQANAIDVMFYRGVDIGDPDLNIAGPQYTVERHGILPVRPGPLCNSGVFCPEVYLGCRFSIVRAGSKPAAPPEP